MKTVIFIAAVAFAAPAIIAVVAMIIAGARDLLEGGWHE